MHYVSLALMVAACICAQGVENCPGYFAKNIKRTKATITADLTLNGDACNVYGEDIASLKLLVEYQTASRLHIKIYDAEEEVFQIPEELLSIPSSKHYGTRNYDFSMETNPFSFGVTRKSNKEVLFNTTGQSLIFESQYLRLRTALPNNPNIYGLGESSDPFRHDPSSYTHAQWTSGQPFMPQNSNLYGDYPVYYDHRGSKGTHAVYLHNSNGMRINLGFDTQHYLEYNAIGGVLDFYIIMGPTPKEVSVQFAEMVGFPSLMPYWSFGFHQCRYGYQDTYETAAVVANYSAANIPLEVIWNDIDYMEYRSIFSLDPFRFPLNRMQQLVKYLHDHDQQYIVMVDPAFASRDYPPFHDGVEMDAFMKESNGDFFTGVVWPGPTNFPDWFAPNSQAFWDQQFDKFFNAKTGVDVDGIWIDMNEASNFCDYPCPEPEQSAIQNRNPPRPPPARMYSPYEITGFPENFQPHCMVVVTFNVDAEIQDGEDLLLLGDTLAMGNSTPYYAPKMTGSSGDFSLTVQLPADTEVTYNYARYTHDGAYINEAKNHTLRTGQCGTQASVSDSWIIPSNETTISSRSSNFPNPAQHIEKRPTISTKGSGPKMGIPGRELIDPPYDIQPYFGKLSGQTLPTNLRHANGLYQYDVHNFYGSVMGTRTHTSLQTRRPGRRPFIITRSSYVGDSTRVGHWFGDNRSIDDDYRLQITQMIQFVAMYQMPMVGSDVCGFNYDTNPTLCARWAVLGSWNPFFRNHAEYSSISQEFYRWDIVADAARKAIATRYRLLDYTYTNFYRQNQTGVPMLTPVMWQYPDDTNTFDIEFQFFAGEAFMVAPVTTPNATTVTFYMPEDLFYDFDTFEEVEGKGEMVTREDIGLSEIPVYVRGGHIVPMRTKSAYTTTALRREPLELIIAPNARGEATGTLYLDDGESIHPANQTLVDFSYKHGTLSSKGKFTFDSEVGIVKLTVLGSHSSQCAEGGSGSNAWTRELELPLTKPFSIDLAKC